MRAERLRLVVGVLTYRREALLGELLPLLEQQVDDLAGSLSGSVEARVVVVDNDPARSAETVARTHHSPSIRYVHEPRRGISAGRNRALDEAADADVLVFIDDDERPGPGWLVALVSTFLTHDAAAVAGPVVSEFMTSPPAFVTAGGFFERAHHAGRPTGSTLDRAATNNLLVDLRVVRRLGLRFDPDFGLSGGEDSMFTGSLTGAGARIVWCAEAAVTDLVPVERLTLDYLLRRTANMSQSSVLAETRLRARSAERVAFRARTLARETARMLIALLQLLVGTVARSLPRKTRARRSLARSIGSFRGLLGRWPVSYGAQQTAQVRSRG